MADLKRKDHFTYVITYTFAGVNQAVADQFKNYLQSSIHDDGFEAINIDQSTYATRRDLPTETTLNKLKNKLDGLYQEHKLKKNPDDEVYLLCNPQRAWKGEVNFPIDIYRFDVFDYIKK